jgi:hypothetical protein
MRLQVATDPRRSDVAIRAALATLGQLAGEGAVSFPLGPFEQRRFDALEDHDAAYIAHEYLGGSFNALMFADVAEELSAARCSFLGTTSPSDVALNLRVPPGLVAMAEGSPDAALRETICDLATNTMFRADVFRRGLRPVAPADHERWLDDFSLIGLGKAYEPDARVETLLRPVVLDEPRYRPLIERLADGPLSIREMRELEYFRDRDQTEAVMAAAMLVKGSYALPGAPGWPDAGGAGPTSRLNRVLVESTREGHPFAFFASPATTMVVLVDPLEMLAVGEMWEAQGADEPVLVTGLLDRIEQRGRPVIRDGAVVTEPAEIRALAEHAVREAIRSTTGHFPHLQIR